MHGQGYVSFFSVVGLEFVKPEFRVVQVTLDGDFTLAELKALVTEFEQRLEALPPEIRATLKDTYGEL